MSEAVVDDIVAVLPPGPVSLSLSLSLSRAL